MANLSDANPTYLPPQASTVAADVDNVFNFILALDTLFFVAIIGAGMFFLLRYRARPGGPKAVPISHNTALEVAWSVLPLLLLFVIFGWGYRGYLAMQVVPRDAMEVHVTGKKWLWTMEYAEGFASPKVLVVPVNKPVKLVMSAEDVLHSFYVPAFRVKQDVVPGRITNMWFQATQEGEFDLFCAEYCGTEHSSMIGKVKVVSEANFKKWIEEQSRGKEPTAELGKQLFAANACIGCHQVVQGAPQLVGPSLWGALGRQEKLADGTVVEVDENYLRESILRPNAKVVAGFQPVMPTFEGSLKEWQIRSLIMYIKTLK